MGTAIPVSYATTAAYTTGPKSQLTANGSAVASGNATSGAFTADQALFLGPQGLAAGPDGTIYIADTGNSAVRCLKDGQVTIALR